MCLCSHRCVCFDRCEERRLNVQTEKKKQSLFILTHSIQKLNFLIGLAKRSFGNCSQKSTNHKGGKVGCGNFNCAPPSKPFMDQNKTNRKNKDSRTACLWRSISYMKLLSDSSSFFCYCTAFLHDIYSVFLTIQNTMQPEELAGGEEVKHGMRWVDRRTTARKELRWTTIPVW